MDAARASGDWSRWSCEYLSHWLQEEQGIVTIGKLLQVLLDWPRGVQGKSRICTMLGEIVVRLCNDMKLSGRHHVAAQGSTGIPNVCRRPWRRCQDETERTTEVLLDKTRVLCS